MKKTLKDFFKLHNLKKQDKRLVGINGTLRFDIRGAGHWRLAVKDGNLKVTSSTAGADCVFDSGEEDFLKILHGKQNLLTAVMQGRVKVRGDFMLAQKFNSIVRSNQAFLGKGL